LRRPIRLIIAYERLFASGNKKTPEVAGPSAPAPA
jgi:hypothetical protein